MTNSKLARISELRAIARILHNVFFYEPTTENLHLLEQIIITDEWPQLANSEEAQQGLTLLRAWVTSPESQKALKLEFGRLFYGPHAPTSAPWGSVYTDEQHLLNGVTTQALMRFFTATGISFQLDSNQPLDHVGLIFAALDVLLERMEQDETNTLVKHQLIELLEVHLQPWVSLFLDSVIEHSNTDLYKGFAYISKSYIETLNSFLAVA